MNITQTEYAVDKALTPSLTNVYELEEMTSLMGRTQLKPKLLSALLNPKREYFMQDVYRFDEVTQSLALPNGKSYSEHGKSLTKDRARQLMYEIPSFGLHFNVAPKDYANRRKYGTTDQLMTEADVLAAMASKADSAWELFLELQLAHLITTDTNLLSGAPATQYNFYTDIVGTARGAKVDMDLGGTGDIISAFRKQRQIQNQELARAKDSASQQIVICGSDFFDKRYEVEKQEGLARPLKSEFDFTSEALPETAFDGQWRYDNFKSHDGLTYIHYGSEIIAGQKLIGDSDGYLIPVGAQNLVGLGYAPAQTRQHVNTVAQEKYGWTKVDDRQGVSVWTESNFLAALKNPRAIQHLTTNS